MVREKGVPRGSVGQKLYASDNSITYLQTGSATDAYYSATTSLVGNIAGAMADSVAGAGAGIVVGTATSAYFNQTRPAY